VHPLDARLPISRPTLTFFYAAAVPPFDTGRTDSRSVRRPRPATRPATKGGKNACGNVTPPRLLPLYTRCSTRSPGTTLPIDASCPLYTTRCKDIFVRPRFLPVSPPMPILANIPLIPYQYVFAVYGFIIAFISKALYALSPIPPTAPRKWPSRCVLESRLVAVFLMIMLYCHLPALAGSVAAAITVVDEPPVPASDLIPIVLQSGSVVPPPCSVRVFSSRLRLLATHSLPAPH
jgi:hypothetical protein